MTMLDYATLSNLLDHRMRADCPCPDCGPLARDPQNRTRKVLRLWYVSEHAISFHCARCKAKGHVVDWRAKPLSDEAREAFRRKVAEARSDEEWEKRRKRKLSEWLWSQSRSVAGTLGETYFRQHRAIRCMLPPSMRFVAANGVHSAAVLMPFLDPATGAIHGLHLTRLNPDGAKIDKIMLGTRSTGFPLICSDIAADHLIICEGVEDALSLTQVVGLPSWAAGSAGRLPALADRIPAWVTRVTISEDPDPAGKTGTANLEKALRWKGLGVAVMRWDEEEAS